MGHPAVQERLSRLTPDQRTAATAPPGPVLCVAPAGSGKTTTLVARIAWLVDGGARPATIAAITFNKRAAEELGERARGGAGAAGCGAGDRPRADVPRPGSRDPPRCRPVGRTADRPRRADRRPVARTSPAERGRLDTAFSRLKLDLAVTADGRRGRPRRRAGRAGLRHVRAGARGAWWPRLRRPRPARARRPRERAVELWTGGGDGARTCSSTRCRTSTARSCGLRCCSPRRRTGSSSSVTTTSRSTAGASPMSVACWRSGPRCRASGESTSRSTTAARRRSSSELSG